MLMMMLSALLIGAPEGTTAKAGVSVSGAVSTAGNLVTCRKYKVTGSLVRQVKECRTESEWKKVTDAARATSGRMVQDGTGRPPGGN